MSIQPTIKAAEHLINSTPVLEEKRKRKKEKKKKEKKEEEEEEEESSQCLSYKEQ